MNKLIYALFAVVLVYSCAKKMVHKTDFYEIKLKNQTRDTLKTHYWNYMELDPYKWDYLLRQNNIHPDSVQSITFIKQNRVKFK